MKMAELYLPAEATISVDCSIRTAAENFTLTSDSLSELRRLLDKGFYGDNFEELASISWGGAQSASNPLGLYILWSIFRPLANKYGDDNSPLTVEYSGEMEQHFIPPIALYLDAVLRGAPFEHEVELLKTVLEARFSWPYPFP